MEIDALEEKGTSYHMDKCHVNTCLYVPYGKEMKV